MNKKFAAFFADNNMTVSGNTAYGIVRGYETNAVLSTMDTVSPFRLHIAFYATDDSKRAIQTALRDAAIKFFNFNFTPYGLQVGLNDLTIARLINRLPSVMDLIYGTLSDNGALGEGFCPVCGNPMEPSDDKKHVIDGLTVTLDDGCLSTINAVIDAENKDFAEAPNNYLFGFCGALVGGIAGGLLAVIVYALGFISSIASVVAVLLGAFLYQKFHGKPNKMMLVIVSCTTLVCMVLSVLIVYVAAAGMAAQEAGVAMSAFEAFAFLMKDAEFSVSFYTDLAMVLVFSAIGVGVEIYYLRNKVRRQKTID
ncbi:MAG: hypothetical protein ACI4S9_01395 [Christensenellales bacterium]